MRDFTRIKLREEEKVLRVILARPEKHNAFDETTVAELTKAFAQTASDKRVRAVLLEAEGENFCAGADLEWMQRAKKFSAAQNRRDALKLAEMILSVYTLPKPVVCAVQGGVYGGGVGLVAACDIAIGAEDATFCLSEARLGLAPAVISPILLRKLGESACRKIILTAEKFSAQEAKAFGLLHQVVPPSALRETADATLSRILKSGPRALSACKELMLKVPTLPLSKAKAYTAQVIARLRTGEEGQEGIAAFLEKRKPSFTE